MGQESLIRHAGIESRANAKDQGLQSSCPCQGIAQRIAAQLSAEGCVQGEQPGAAQRQSPQHVAAPATPQVLRVTVMYFDPIYPHSSDKINTLALSGMCNASQPSPDRLC